MRKETFMKKTISIKDSSVSIDNEKFSVKSKNALLELSFSKELGFTVDSFKNFSGNRVTEYIKDAQCILPIGTCETEESKSNKKSHELMNAVTRNDGESEKIKTENGNWQLLCSDAKSTSYGGAEVLKLTAEIENESYNLTFHSIAFPECSVIRYWFDIKNVSKEKLESNITPFALEVYSDRDYDIFRAAWFTTAVARQNFGRINEMDFGVRPPKIEISSKMTAQYVPLVVLYRDGAPHDGVMIEMDYISHWNMSLEKTLTGIDCRFGFDGKNSFEIMPDEVVSTPTITLATYSKDMDELMVTLYDWQYTYMWEYTLSDYYGKLRSQNLDYPWVYCSRILNEQFSYRIAGMNLLASKSLSAAGIDIGWDDAGWSSFPGWPDDSYMTVFKNTYEGPDHRLSTRYYEKLGMKRLIWFAGKPSTHILETKEGAWGEFEWRTDEVYNTDFKSESAFKKLVKSYLDGGIRRSFHTCSGGSTYANTFDIQKLANYHYLSDNGMGPCSTYYFTYFTLPDRWGDTLPGLGGEYYATDGSHSFKIQSDKKKYYNPTFARGNLIMAGKYCPVVTKNIDLHREDSKIYDYLKAKGVAGRWSYMFHPGVYGDREYYYMQRTSRDRLRAAIIIRRCPEGRVVLYPKGLIETENYAVTFEISNEKFTKTGKELMEEGFVIKNVSPRELIYFNLPDSPSKANGAPMPTVKKVICKRENNVGTSGIGIYWSADDECLGCYEIARDGKVIGKNAKFRYFFDTDADFEGNAVYSVRAVGYGNRIGEWVDGEYLEGESLVYSTLGAHGENLEKMNWKAELSYDLINFLPMKWIPPAKEPGADQGGTPNQDGGIEGYFEGGQCAKIGRGWQQASPDAYCVRTFMAPFAGKITLTGRAVKEWYHSEYGSDLEVSVMKNGEVLIPFSKILRSDISGISYNLTLDVQKGDTLRFILGKCDSQNNDDTHYEKNANIIGWNNIIEYPAPEKEKKNFVCRINCAGKKFVDTDGMEWSADTHFACGEKKGNENTLFDSWRAGESLSYKIPVPTGIYAVRLLFSENEYGYSNERYMQLKINGSLRESELDVAQSARGVKTPFGKVYHYVIPDENGEINLSLKSIKGEAMISAIEIMSENDDVYHINCGGEDFVDWAGYVWHKDVFFEGGNAVSNGSLTVKQASPTLYDKALYSNGREGMDFSYKIPVRDGIYSVQLKFAEFKLISPQSRPVDIYVNGRKLKENYDCVRSAEESPMSRDVRFDDVSSQNGLITIRIKSLSSMPAILRAIEID